MISRRSLLKGAGISAPFIAAKSANAVGLLQSVLSTALTPRTVYGAALFPTQAGIASNFHPNGVPKETQLINMGGNATQGYSQTGSVAGSFITFLRSNDIPSQIMRLFSASNSNGFEHFLIDILPPGTGLTVFNATTGNVNRTAYNVPALRIKAAVIIAGTLKINTFISEIPRFIPGAWQLYEVFLNSIVAGGAASLIVGHFIKDDPNHALETLQTTIGWPNNDPPMGPLNAPAMPKLRIPWGITGTNTVLDFTVGSIPGAIGGSLRNTVLESMVFSPLSADPYWTTSNLVTSTGAFNKQPIGAPNLFVNGSGVSPIHLTGGVVPGIDVGFGFNGGGRLDDVNGDVLFIDTTFNGVPGNNPIEPAIDFGSPFSDED